MVLFFRRSTLFLICLLFSFYCKGESDSSDEPIIVYIRDSFYETCVPFLKRTISGKVQYVKLSSSLLMGRLRLEKNKSRADLVIGADSCLSPEIMALDITGKNRLKATDYDIPVPWKYTDIIPFCYSYLGILYDESRLKEPPETFEDILESSLKISIPHPRTSTVGLVFFDWFKTKSKDLFQEKWRHLHERLLLLPKGLSESFSLFVQGECDLTVAYITSVDYAALRRQRMSIRSLPFKGLPLHAYTAFLTLKGSRKEKVHRILKALLSSDIQRQLITKDALYPVQKEIKLQAKFQQKEPLPVLPLHDFTRQKRQALLLSLESLSRTGQRL